VILPFGLMLRGPARHLLEVALAVTYLTPVAGEFAGWGGQIWLHTWSLGIEEIFYLIWPLTLILLARLGMRHQPWITVGLLGFLFAAAQAALVFSGYEPSYFLRSAGMLFGCSLALWLSSNRTQPTQWAGWSGLVLIIVSVMFGNIDRWNSLAYSVAALGTVGVIAAVIRTPDGPITRALSIRPAVYVGKISYELYLWHYPVLVCIMLAMGSDNLNVGSWLGIPLAVALAALTEWRLRRPTAWLRSRFA
jgi:peptidoglycan/LPS O-acetylase OafA/YrhL